MTRQVRFQARIQKWFGLVGAALVLAGTAHAAAPTLIFSERAQTKLLDLQCFEGGYSIVTSGRELSGFTTRMPLGSVSPTQFNAGTPVEVRIGSMVMGGYLGNDPRYVPGRTSVLLEYKAPADEFGSTPPTIGLLRLRWTRTSITVQGGTTHLGTYGIASDELKEQSGVIRAEVPAYIRVGDFEFTRTLHAVGQGTPQVIDRCGEPQLLPNFKLSGKADYTRPTVKVRQPVRSGVVTNSTVLFSGTAKDNVRVASVQIQINSQPRIAAEGTTNWSASVSLPAGTNNVWVVSVDQDGNESSAVRRRLIVR